MGVGALGIAAISKARWTVPCRPRRQAASRASVVGRSEALLASTGKLVRVGESALRDRACHASFTVELLDFVAQRIITMTPSERRQFDALMKGPATTGR
jgi:hypothetical protein